jgi:hypothetical protein
MLKELKLNTIFDVGQCFSKKKYVTDLLYLIIQRAGEQKEKKQDVVVYNNTYNFYQFDSNFILDTFVKWLKKVGVAELEIEKFKMFFNKDSNVESLDNWLMLMAYFRRHNLTIGNNRKQYFALALFHNKSDDRYFKLDAIGFVRSGIDELVTSMYREEALDTVAIDSDVESIAYGVGSKPGKVPFEMKKLKQDGKQVFSFSDSIS